MNNTKITTERLIIRPFADGDLDDLTALIRDKMASEYAFTDTQWPTDDASMKKNLEYCMSEKPWCWCAVELKITRRVIGFVYAGGDSTRSLGYTIRSDHQNNGYAYEACGALMKYCVESLGTQRFESGTADCNIPSVRLLQKLGFTKVESIETSFTKDSEGNPILFAGGRYERTVKA
jgi:RimJ/RimL family protein N-acetyltransferase